MAKTLSQRSIDSVKWNSISRILTAFFKLLEAMILAHLLPVEVFGIYAGAVSTITLTGMFANFGMGGAMIHRASETEDLEQAAATHFVLKTAFTIVWVLLMLLGTWLFIGEDQSELRLAFVVVTLTAGIVHLAQTPHTMLVRLVHHQRLAILQMSEAGLSFVIAIGIALGGATLWALLISNVVSACLQILLLYVWRPVWRPQLLWDIDKIRYFLRFGLRNFIAGWLLMALDQIDDIWTGVFLGKQPLGFYSRAYSFARYPSYLLATPLHLVVAGSYAELKNERERLSKAFVQVNALMIRSAFLLGGILALVAPEFIRIVLGAKWLPMLDAFRFMLVFTLLDPMKQTIASVYIALGMPEMLGRFRFIQFIVMMIGLFILGLPFGITGVAVAVDVMLVAGIGMMLWHIRTWIDFSYTDLFLVPTIALVVALAVVWLVEALSGGMGSDWASGAAKSLSFTLIYGIILVLFERQRVVDTWLLAKRAMLSREREERKQTDVQA
jgi:O-antigen/teichoic acid export membrane protein